MFCVSLQYRKRIAERIDDVAIYNWKRRPNTFWIIIAKVKANTLFVLIAAAMAVLGLPPRDDDGSLTKIGWKLIW